MDAPDLNSLFVHFDQKISNICAKLALLDTYIGNDKNECVKVNIILGNIQYMLHTINQLLNDAEKDFKIRSKRYNQVLQLVEDHVEYIENNLPVAVQLETKTETKSFERNATYTNLSVKRLENTGKNNTGSISVSKKTDNCKNQQSSSFPIMEHITEKEYDSIPKYMLSRLSLTTLNDSVKAFNETIKAKYTFIKKFDVQSTKDVEYKRYQLYKSQENADTKGLYFATITDIKELSSMKNDSTLRKALICLRHCKRIKEIRGNPQKLIRYCLI